MTVTLAPGDTTPVAATLLVGPRAVREVLLPPGVATTLRVPPLPVGWTEVAVALAPDEFRLDDTARAIIRVAPPAAVRWVPGDRWLDAAMGVLVADGRIRAGSEVTLGTLGPGPSVVVPTEDPALLPALNRALAARGIAWQYGAPVSAPARVDSGSTLPFRPVVYRRVALERADAGGGDTLVTADGAPWAVRQGEVVLLGSRFDPAWTELPISTGFVPFLDLLLTRAVRGEPPLPTAAVGVPVALPERATAVLEAEGTRAIEGGGMWRARTPGVHYLLAEQDTIGAVMVALPETEVDLARATDAELRAQWPGAVVRATDDAGAAAFGAAGRGDLRPFLLLLALGCVLGESVLAGRGRNAVR